MPKYKDSPEVRAEKRKKREIERISAIAGCRRLQ